MGLRYAIGLLAALLLAGCSSLPSAGPSASTISSTSYLSEYAVIDISSEVIDVLRGRYDPTFAGTFGTGGGGGGSGRINVGDRVVVTIWEASSGGLFSTESGVGGGTKTAIVPEQQVSHAGTIFVPYAGELKVAGRTTAEVQSAIIAGLDGKAIEPQALVSLVQSHSNAVTVLGEGSRGGRVPLSVGDDRLLDVIATGSSISGSTNEIFIQVTRGKKTARVPLETVLADPNENIFVKAGDTITLFRDPQGFTIFGAAGRNAEIKFPARVVALSEALGLAGGLNEFRSDARGVFIFRREPREIVQKMAPDAPVLKRDLDLIPVIYRIDLSVPMGTFLARDFRIFNKDVLYIADSPSTELLKFLSVVNNLLSSARSTVALKRSLDAL